MAIVVVLMCAVPALWVMLTFNRLVRLRNQSRTAWADIDVQLQRRHDLVPRLVEVVKGYAAHERATLAAVTELRAQAQSAHGAAVQGQAEDALSQALGRLIALREAYPELKANRNFAQLSAALVEVEDHLQYARRFYNGGVRELNTKIRVFPNNLIARRLGFGEREFFEVADAAAIAEPPRVQF